MVGSCDGGVGVGGGILERNLVFYSWRLCCIFGVYITNTQRTLYQIDKIISFL